MEWRCTLIKLCPYEMCTHTHTHTHTQPHTHTHTHTPQPTHPPTTPHPCLHMRRGEEHLGMAQPTDAQCHLNEHTHLNSYIEPSSLSLSFFLSLPCSAPHF